MLLAMFLLASVPGGPGISESAVGQAPILRNEAQVFTHEDYPEKALQARSTGIVSAVVRVSSEGKPTACAITETSGDKLLDQATCQLIVKRGLFDPARDVAGMPIAADYRLATSWGAGNTFPSRRIVLDLEVNAVPADYRRPVNARLEFGETGRVIACEISNSSGSISADQATCAYAKGQLSLDAPKAVGGTVSPVAVRYVTASLHQRHSAQPD